MNRLIVGGLIAATCAIGQNASAADAYDDTGAWYLSPMAQYTFLSDKRIAKDHLGFQGGLGYDFAPNFAAELNMSWASFHVRGSGTSEKLNTKSVDVLYKFMPITSVVRPFVLLGAGGMSDYIGAAPEYNAAWLAEAGVGALTALGSQSGSARLQLRTEVKYRREFIQGVANIPRNPGDVIVGVGFQFMFGAPTPPPVVAKAAPPVEEPPTPPPPPPPAPPVDGDDDGDGVPNSIDKCPNTPKGDLVDAYGCTIKDEIKLEGVNFATDSAELVPESDYVLSYGVATLKKHPDFVIEVHGHTDNRGSAQHNLLLSRRRAESVMTYLRNHGVTNTMTAKGYGKDHPIADNTTADGRLQNRRVSLHVVNR